MTSTLIVPAVNILGGKVVRLRQGDPTRSTVYSEDPLAVAQRFADDGAQRLYVQDIDSLSAPGLAHLETAKRIAYETGVEVIFGATIRDQETAEMALDAPFTLIELRADRIMGTPFLKSILETDAGRIALRLDVRDGNVHQDSPGRDGVADPVVIARELTDSGAQYLVYSDLNRDGMLGGPNYAGLRALLRVAAAPVIVSGGIAHHDHIRNLERLGVQAVIIGKALYTGDLSLHGHLNAHGGWRF